MLYISQTSQIQFTTWMSVKISHIDFNSTWRLSRSGHRSKPVEAIFSIVFKFCLILTFWIMATSGHLCNLLTTLSSSCLATKGLDRRLSVPGALKFDCCCLQIINIVHVMDNNPLGPIKDLCHLLQTTTLGLWEDEEDGNKHENQHANIDEVELPRDSSQCKWINPFYRYLLASTLSRKTKLTYD